MKSRTIGIILTVLGIAVIALSLYQAQAEVKIIAWYDMNGDNVINYKDFDVNNDDLVNWIDVQLVQEAANSGTYIERYDFNLDGVVDQTDVDIVHQWLGEGRMALYDMNGDGIVDWHDLDINEDGKVDMMDIGTVARAYGSKIGDAKYNPKCDFNMDGVIDDADLDLIKPYFGYPLSIYNLFNITLPIGQLFIIGVILTLLGTIIILTSKGG
ncbi:hypothetical protein DRO69_01390 [Candidatus Bathyarchaeota archaeon]|nr:MAG: hypothetical protein DRO69_01390 [Candidatus Bathyarchaeota archaeon]